MVKADDDVQSRLDDLIVRAAAIGGEDWAAFRAYATQAAAAVVAIAGKDSDYYSPITANPIEKAFSAGSGVKGVREGIVVLRDDVAHGYLRRQAALVAAEVFGDFLDMAGHLLDQGYIPRRGVSGRRSPRRWAPAPGTACGCQAKPG